MVKQYRFKLTLEYIYSKDKTISHHIYATSNSEANVKATNLFNRLKEINPKAYLLDIKEVTYDPIEDSYA